MVLVGVLFYVINALLCFWAIEIIIKGKNVWYVIHAITAFTIATLNVIWYYGDDWIIEAMIFLVGGILIHVYKTFKSKFEISILSGKPNYLTYTLLFVVILTIILRIVI